MQEIKNYEEIEDYSCQSQIVRKLRREKGKSSRKNIKMLF